MGTISRDTNENTDSGTLPEEREITIRMVDDENLQKYLNNPLLTKLQLSNSNIHGADFSILEEAMRYIDNIFINRYNSITEILH